MLTDLQRQKQSYIFNLLDFDSNGFIEREDFVGIAENLCIVRGEELDSDEAQQVLEQCHQLWDSLEFYIDANRDDKCTLDEWLLFVDLQLVNNDSDDGYHKYIDSVVGRLFDLYDTNGDGHISIDEFIDIFLSFRLEAGLVAKSFKMLDINGDGIITKEELVKAVNEFLLSNNIDAPGNWIFGNWSVESYA